MRKLIIFLAVFLLLSVPAMADTSDSATVTVTITEAFGIDVLGNWTLLFDDVADYPFQTSMHQVVAHVQANASWKMTAKITDDWDEVATQAWILQLSADLGVTFPTVTTAGETTLISGMAAGHYTGGTVIKVWASVSNVLLPDIGDACTVTMTVSAG